ncbi:tripartite tricarboxylate transporter substrate binding protein [Paenibacillus sp. LMG 31456]|uniref:Tripartite tricarboxylate transporter substrate binding protein n=1 Tax=Paenibacillus foliorum TaxID=2654974 RepID=A0A972GS84_9BACL|nr:tripartite tricarboxylate transporter substrate binding protein [Paenibacillus foliorum]NOU93509.1 tripartite tricarboxylate transporter substrate binding protein [Paenibacillus foliorum]
MKKAILGASLSLALLLGGCGAQGASTTGGAAGGQAKEQPKKAAFPEKEITLVVPFAPGGASDSTARIIAKGMEEKLKKPVVVINKSGGTGGVGLSYVQASPKDGYTLSYAPVELVMHKALGLSDLEPSKFDMLAQATVIPAALTVNANAPYNTVEEFIEFAKKNPSKIKVGNSGAGSIWHVASTAFATKAGVTFSDIPFDGAAPAVTALMGGHLDAVTVSTGEVKSAIESKKVKVLAIMDNQRDKNFPDVPTLKEKGIDVQIAGWGGFVLPKGTPDDVKAVLADALKEAVNSEAFKKFAAERGFTLSYKAPADYTKYADDQFKFFSELIPTMKLK